MAININACKCPHLGIVGGEQSIECEYFGRGHHWGPVTGCRRCFEEGDLPLLLVYIHELVFAARRVIVGRRGRHPEHNFYLDKRRMAIRANYCFPVTYERRDSRMCMYKFSPFRSCRSPYSRPDDLILQETAGAYAAAPHNSPRFASSL